MACLRFVHPNQLTISFDAHLNNVDLLNIGLIYEQAGGLALLKVPGTQRSNGGNKEFLLGLGLDVLLTFIRPFLKNIDACLYDNAHKIIHRERLMVDVMLFDLFYDPLTMANTTPSGYQRSGEVAVVTHVYNEGAMLEFWERHYGQIFGFENLFVIDDGSTDSATVSLHVKTNVVRIPRGPLDHLNMAEYCGYFQRFLLKRYAWVINTDCDEILVANGGLNSLLKGSPPGTYCPEYAVAAVHDVTHESAFDFSKPLAAQRNLYVSESDLFLKPMISSQPTTWGPGFHTSKESSSPLSGVWLVHLRYVDQSRLYQRNLHWSGMKQTPVDETIYRGLSKIRTMSDRELVQSASDEISELLAQASPVTVPDFFYDCL
jgi:hypothetical protein